VFKSSSSAPGGTRPANGWWPLTTPNEGLGYASTNPNSHGKRSHK
jgi:hypothetical protein